VKSALYDHGVYDNSRYDTLVAEITGSWTSNNDPWSGGIYVYDPLWISWTADDDSWAGTARIYNGINAIFNDGADAWNCVLAIRPADVSYWDDQPDVWKNTTYITLQPPIYSAGGGWWINVWGDRLPNWKERRDNLENAYAAWRYKVTGAWTSQDSTWRGSIVLADVQEDRLQQQMRLMFHKYEPEDEDEDLLWLI